MENIRTGFARMLSNPLRGFLRFRIERPDGAPPLREPEIPASVMISSVFINLLALGLPLTILQIYDRILPNAATETLSMLILGLTGVLILDAVMKTARAYIIGWTASSFNNQASKEAFKRLLKAPSTSVEKNPVSVHINRFNALSTLADFYGGQSRLLMVDLPSVTIFMTIMFLVGGAIVAVPVVLFGVFALLTYRRNQVLQKTVKERSLQDDKKYDFVIEVLSGIRTVKSMAMEPQIQRRFERLQGQVAGLSYQSIRLSGLSQAFASLYSNISTVSVVGFGALLAIKGDLSIGSVACCTLLSGQIMQPLLRAISLWTEIQNVNHKLDEAKKLFDLPLMPETPAPADDFPGHIILNNLSLKAEDSRHTSITSLSLDIPAGEIISIKGEDGSGKTTLMQLLNGEIRLHGGDISVDGHSLNGPETPAIRQRIVYAGQPPVIFRGTILENITMFKKSVSVQDAREAARLIGLEQKIHGFPMGYDTRLGEGVTGNIPAAIAQQVCIARAIAGKPRILLLDEVNTALDKEGEENFIQALKDIRGSMTIVLVCHRPSLQAIADRCFEMRNGDLIQIENPAKAISPAQQPEKPTSSAGHAA